MTHVPDGRSPAGEPHHDGSPLYVSNPEPVLGEAVRVRMRVPRSFGALRSVRTRSNPDREPHYAIGEVVAETPDAVWWQAELIGRASCRERVSRCV